MVRTASGPERRPTPRYPQTAKFTDEFEDVHVPESRNRKKDAYTPPPAKGGKAGKLRSKRWVAPVMLVCFIVGLAWIVVFYLSRAAGMEVPGMATLGNWNILVGMGLIAVGFIVATQWE